MRVTLKDRVTSIIVLLTFILTSVVSYIPAKEAEAANEPAFKYICLNPGLTVFKEGNTYKYKDNYHGSEQVFQGSGNTLTTAQIYMTSDYKGNNYSAWDIVSTYDLVVGGGTINGASLSNIVGPGGEPKGSQAQSLYREHRLARWVTGPRKFNNPGEIVIGGTVEVDKRGIPENGYGSVATSVVLVMKHNDYNADTGTWNTGGGGGGTGGGDGGGGGGGEVDPPPYVPPGPECSVTHRFNASLSPIKVNGSYKDISGDGTFKLNINMSDYGSSTVGHDMYEYIYEVSSQYLAGNANTPAGWNYTNSAALDNHRWPAYYTTLYTDRVADPNRISVAIPIKPTPAMLNSGKFDVICGAVPQCECDLSATPATASFTVEVSFGNRPPTASGGVAMKVGGQTDHLWRARTIVFTDRSTDPENDLMDRIYVIRYKNADGTWKDVATIKGTRNSGGSTAWTYAPVTGLDKTYVKSVTPNQNGFEFQVEKLGDYSIYQKVGDVKNVANVAQLWDDNTDNNDGKGTPGTTFTVDKDPAPPTAAFDYIVGSSAVESTFIGARVDLKDKSTDPDNDIVAWTWEPRYLTPSSGTMTKGSLNTKDSYIVPNTVGTIITKLTVRDDAGFINVIEKRLKVGPPVPSISITIPDPDNPNPPGGGGGDGDGGGGKITPRPNEVISNKSYLKENRMLIIDIGNSGNPPTSPIQWARTEWKVVDSRGNLIPADKYAYTEASDHKSRNYLFREKGTYYFQLTMHNTYTDEHPEEDLSNASIKFGVKIAEDKAPTPSITVTGNSANFKDNPRTTSVTLKDSSVSKDNDYIKDDVQIKPDNTSDSAFGRGVNAYDWKVILDANDDGIFDPLTGDTVVYDTRDGASSFNFNVPFQANTKGKYRIFFTVRETFGQKTISKFVTNADRRTASLTKDFTVNWVPDITYDFGDSYIWQEEDYTFTTQVKDERPETTTTTWWVEELRVGRDYVWVHEDGDCTVPADIFESLPLLPSGDKDVTGTPYKVGTYHIWPIDTPVEQKLEWKDVIVGTPDSTGGTISFKVPGKFRIHCRITDEVGQSYEYYDDIRVAPKPVATISNDPDLRWMYGEWTAKQNRTFGLIGAGSVTDPYLNVLRLCGHPLYKKPEALTGTALVEGKGYLEIHPMDGQPLDGNVYVVEKGQDTHLPSQTTEYYSRKDISTEIQVMFKQVGRYKVRWKMFDEAGKESHFADAIITVVADEKPSIDMRIDDFYYRDPSNSNLATVLLYDIDTSSKDLDNMVDTKIEYRFDSDNDGSFDDETWKPVNAPVFDPDTNLGTTSFDVSHVGKYQVKIYSREEFGQPTLDKYIKAEDHLDGTVYVECVVDNYASKVDLSAMRGHKVDIVIATGQVPDYKLSNLNSKVNTYVKNLLAANGASVVDSVVQMIETSSVGTETSFPWKKYEAQNGHIKVSGTSYVYDGYTTAHTPRCGSPIDHYYYDDGKSANRRFQFDINMNGYNRCATLIPVFFFGCDDKSTFKGYTVGLRHDTVTVFSFDVPGHYSIAKNGGGGNSIAFGQTFAGSTLLATWDTANPNSMVHKFDLQYSPNGDLKVYDSGKLLGSINLPPKGTGYGLGAGTSSHGCSTNSTIRFDGFKLTTSNQKYLSDILSGEVVWRDGAQRIVINLDDMTNEITGNFAATDSTEIAKLSALLSADNIAYVGLGNPQSYSTHQKIASGATNGVVFNNESPNVDTALRNAGQWILDLINSQNQGDIHYILLDKLISYQQLSMDYENDPRYAQHSKWYYEHDPDYFKNSMGVHDKAGQWLDGSINSFNRTGYYQVTWQIKDNPVGNDDRFDEYRKLSSMVNGPLNLFVHRKPIADFDAKITKNAGKFTIAVTDRSYDLDHEGEPGNGIRQVKWSWKNVNDLTWTEGKRTEFPTTSEFLVKLEVQDIDGKNGIGVWSDPMTIFLTTSAQPPVAKFSVTPKQLPLGTDMTMQDTSFDPNGDPIVEYRFELYFKGNKVRSYTKTNSTGVTDAQIEDVRKSIQAFIESKGHQGYGDWKITMQCRDNTGAWGDKKATSDVYTQMFNVKPNNRKPEITIVPDGGGAVHSDDDTWSDGTDSNNIGLAQPVGYRRNVYVDAVTTDASILNAPFVSWRNYLNKSFHPRITVSDPDADSAFPNHDGFKYTWEFKNHSLLNGVIKSTAEMTDEDVITTKVIGPQHTTSTSHTPFTNSFRSNGLLPGPYELIATIEDKPLYGSPQKVQANLKFYVVPDLTGTITVTPYADEIIADELVKVTVTTNKWTDSVDVRLDKVFNASNPYTSEAASAASVWTRIPFKSSSAGVYVYEADYLVPEIEESGDYYFTARLNTTAGSMDVYGEPNQITRYRFVAERHAVTALKILDINITDMVHHPEYDGDYPLTREDMPVNYTSGYYMTFQVKTKGKPDEVHADVWLDGANGGTVEFKQVGEDGSIQIWEARYMAPPDTPLGTEIKFELSASRGATTYDFNAKEGWDGLIAGVTKSAMEDVGINRTH